MRASHVSLQGPCQKKNSCVIIYMQTSKRFDGHTAENIVNSCIQTTSTNTNKLTSSVPSLRLFRTKGRSLIPGRARIAQVNIKNGRAGNEAIIQSD